MNFFKIYSGYKALYLDLRTKYIDFVFKNYSEEIAQEILLKVQETTSLIGQCYPHNVLMRHLNKKFQKLGYNTSITVLDKKGVLNRYIDEILSDLLKSSL